MVGDSVKALTARWNRESHRAIDTITPECLIPDDRGQKAPWFTEELGSMEMSNKYNNKLN